MRISNKSFLILGSGIKNNSASTVITYFFYKSLKKICPRTYNRNIKKLNESLMHGHKINLNKYDYIIVTYFYELLLDKKYIYEKIKDAKSTKILFFDDFFDYKSEFDLCFNPLKKYIKNQKVKYLPYGADKILLNRLNKNKFPTLFIDYDKRKKKLSELNNVLIACDKIKKCVPLKIILADKKDKRADECIIYRIPFKQIWRKFNESWIYITLIGGHYELPVIENQMAGNFIVGIKNSFHKELVKINKTGFIVNNNVKEIKKIILKIINNYNPDIPRNFALKHFDWDNIAIEFIDYLKKYEKSLT